VRLQPNSQILGAAEIQKGLDAGDGAPPPPPADGAPWGGAAPRAAWPQRPEHAIEAVVQGFQFHRLKTVELVAGGFGAQAGGRSIGSTRRLDGVLWNRL